MFIEEITLKEIGWWKKPEIFCAHSHMGSNIFNSFIRMLHFHCWSNSEHSLWGFTPKTHYLLNHLAWSLKLSWNILVHCFKKLKLFIGRYHLPFPLFHPKKIEIYKKNHQNSIFSWNFPFSYFKTNFQPKSNKHVESMRYRQFYWHKDRPNLIMCYFDGIYVNWRLIF